MNLKVNDFYFAENENLTFRDIDLLVGDLAYFGEEELKKTPYFWIAVYIKRKSWYKIVIFYINYFSNKRFANWDIEIIVDSVYCICDVNINRNVLRQVLLTIKYLIGKEKEYRFDMEKLATLKTGKDKVAKKMFDIAEKHYPCN